MATAEVSEYAIQRRLQAAQLLRKLDYNFPAEIDVAAHRVQDYNLNAQQALPYSEVIINYFKEHSQEEILQERELRKLEAQKKENKFTAEHKKRAEVTQQFLRELDLTVEEIAKACRVMQSRVEKWATGLATPSKKYIERLKKLKEMKRNA